MPNYTVRAELKGTPGAAQYEALHALMAGFGLGRTVIGVAKGGTLKTYHLPTGTYYGESASSAADLREDVVAAMQAQLGEAAEVFIAHTVDWAIHLS